MVTTTAFPTEESRVRVDSEFETVFILDDNEDVRSSLTALLKSIQLRVESFASGYEFLERVAGVSNGCALIDQRMPVMSGIDVLRELRRLDSPLPVVMLTAHADFEVAVEAIQLGAVDFLSKSCSEQKFIDKVHEALELSRGRREESRWFCEMRKRLDMLSTREREVMNVVVNGETSREIADRLKIAVKTVDTHRANVMRKVGVSSTVELIRDVLLYRQKRGRSTENGD